MLHEDAAGLIRDLPRMIDAHLRAGRRGALCPRPGPVLRLDLGSADEHPGQPAGHDREPESDAGDSGRLHGKAR